LLFGTGVACANRETPPSPAISPELATILVNYAAVHVCSCLFVSGRTLEACSNDLDPAAKPLVSLKVEHQRVTARTGNIAIGRASYEPGYGCAVQKD
jgi:hypothetical protein